MTLQHVSYGALLLAIILLSVFTFNTFTTAHTVETREVRWLIAHEPTSVFDRAAQIFADAIREKTDGRLRLVVLRPSDVGFDRDVSKTEGYALMDQGKIDLMSAFGVALGTEVPEALAPNVPFAFADYDAAAAFFDEKGGRVLDAVTERTRLTALAITYSGGFRVLAFMTPVSSLKEATEHTIAAIQDETSQLAARVLGVTFAPSSGEESASLEAVDGAEATYSRIAARDSFDGIKSIIETNHGFLYTMIVADDAFFASLSSEEQRALLDAARVAAVAEQEDSIALSSATRAALLEEGVTVVTLSSEETERLRVDALQQRTELSAPVSAVFTEK